MVAATSVCLQLGSASDANNNGDVVVNAATAQDLDKAREGVVPSSVDHLTVVVSASDLGSLYNPMELANWVPFMKTNASVSVKVLGEATDFTPIHTSFLLAGLSGASEKKANGSRMLTATRKAPVTVSAAPLKKASDAVTISLDDDDDMIDEDNLLSDDVLAPPPAMGARTAEDDCSGRKACDNCTCGRADAEKAAEQPKTAPSSSCGKCGLGDAFRCASCPYLGLPAFKPGEEHLVLQLKDDL
eukprot:scaffold26334_cov122-Cylindrotheca_fusiformis.AAC.1